MKKAEIAYLAGFFDGEGCITLAKRSDSPSLALNTSICQANRWILERYRMAFGGWIYLHNKNTKGRPWKTAWNWQTRANISLEFLKVIYPYLILKAAEAKVAIEFQEAKRTNNHRGRKLSEEEIAAEQAQRLLIHNLKDKSEY